MTVKTCMHVSVCLSVCLSPPFLQSLLASLCLSLSLSIYLSLSLSIYLSLYLSLSLSLSSSPYSLNSSVSLRVLVLKQIYTCLENRFYKIERFCCDLILPDKSCTCNMDAFEKMKPRLALNELQGVDKTSVIFIVILRQFRLPITEYNVWQHSSSNLQ